MNIVTNTLLTLIFVGICALSGCLWLFWVKFRALENNIVTFITPQEENKPSQLALTAQLFADMVGRSAVSTAKTVFMGKQSGDVRGEKAVMGDIAVDMAGQTPIGALLTSFPTLRKTLRRNPQLIDAALSVFSGMSRASGIGNSNNGESSSPKFNL